MRSQCRAGGGLAESAGTMAVVRRDGSQHKRWSIHSVIINKSTWQIRPRSRKDLGAERGNGGRCLCGIGWKAIVSVFWILRKRGTDLFRGR
jgi:hypothetical protein